MGILHSMRYKKIFKLFLLMGMLAQAQQKPEAHQLKMDKVSDKVEKQDTVKIAVVLYNNIVLQDFAGPMEVFSKAKNLTKGKYKIFTVGLDAKEIYTENNLLKIQADYTLEKFPKSDYIIIPGASMPTIKELMNNEKLKSSIIQWNENPETTVVSVCTASYLLANSGILNRKKATTHYFVADDFEEHYPKIQLIRNVRFVDEGKMMTSSGITSGIDAALHIVEQNSGEMIRAMINRALQYNFGENENWPIAPNGMRYQSEKNK